MKTLENEAAKLKAKMMKIIPKQKANDEKFKELRLNEIKLTEERKAYEIENKSLKLEINSLKEKNAIQHTKIESIKTSLDIEKNLTDHLLDSCRNHLVELKELKEEKEHLLNCLERKNKKINDFKKILDSFPKKDVEEKKREIAIADDKIKQACEKSQRKELSLQTSQTNYKEKQITANISETTPETNLNCSPEVLTEKSKQIAVDMPVKTSVHCPFKKSEVGVATKEVSLNLNNKNNKSYESSKQSHSKTDYSKASDKQVKKRNFCPSYTMVQTNGLETPQKGNF